MQRERFTKAFCAAIFSCFAVSISLSQPTIVYTPVITSGLSQPLEVHTAPGDASGRLFIVQKSGEIRIWNGTAVLATSFLDISGISTDIGEQGLLSMAFHPLYATNGYFYVYYNNNAGDIVVARYQVSGNPDIANPAGTILLTISHPVNSNHNGAHLQFKTQGGIHYLYFATGDGGGGNDPNNNAQNPALLLGKMIRMDVDAATPTAEIWSWGLRNPFRWSFDRLNGDMWIGDVGQNQREEISYLSGGSYGANFGWVCMEADIPNAGAPSGIQCDTVLAVDVLPVFAYPNPSPGSSSVIGGYVYRGTEFPSLYGWYVAADFYTGEIFLIEPDGSGGWNSYSQASSITNIASFSETSDGTAIYAPSLGSGIVYKITTPIVTPLNLLSFSGKTSETFNDLQWTADSEVDIVRYEVQFSHDGSTYSSAGFVNSLNNGNRNDYSFRHYQNNNSPTWYRLRISEVNGTFSYSPVIVLRNSRNDTRLFPTVVTGGYLNINTSLAVDKIEILDALGNLVAVHRTNRLTGYFRISLPSNLRGMHFARIHSGHFSETVKFIVQ